MIDLNQLLRQQARPPVKVDRDRRVFERHTLNGASVLLNYQGSSFPCRILDISMGGCRVETDSFFRDGAIANVELDISVFGLHLKICGVTQWSTSFRQVGIRFIHPGVRTKNQVANIISCIIDETAREAVRDALEAEAKAKAAAVAALEAEAAFIESFQQIVQPELVDEPIPASLASVLAVHGSYRRVVNPGPGDWPVEVRDLLADRRSFGVITELSLAGCCVRFAQPFVGSFQHELEVEFEILRLHFRLAGLPRAIHNQHLVGIEFKPMTNRRRDELTQLIDELTSPDQPSGS